MMSDECGVAECGASEILRFGVSLRRVRGIFPCLLLSSAFAASDGFRKMVSFHVFIPPFLPLRSPDFDFSTISADKGFVLIDSTIQESYITVAMQLVVPRFLRESGKINWNSFLHVFNQRGGNSFITHHSAFLISPSFLIFLRRGSE
jgi:hypothetical protein